MTILAIDPGSTHSAIVLWDGERILQAIKDENEAVRALIAMEARKIDVEHVVCERVESYGMAVGATVFDTCFWTGRMWETVVRLGVPFHLVPRREVKLHLCGQARAKDTNIRQALVDRFGDKGTKNNKGLTYHLKADTWQAFALAVTCLDLPRLLKLAGEPMPTEL
jgi:hypothetical protein